MAIVVCLLVGLAASVEDLRRRHISNWTVMAGLAAGLVTQLFLRGWRAGLGAWLGGAAIGFGVFLLFFLAGGMGGGDVKLMAVLGGCVGPAQVLRAALLAAMVGAMAACGYLLWNWFERRALGRAPRQPAAEESIPYAPALVLGTLLSFAGA